MEVNRWDVSNSSFEYLPFKYSHFPNHDYRRKSKSWILPKHCFTVDFSKSLKELPYTYTFIKSELRPFTHWKNRVLATRNLPSGAVAKLRNPQAPSLARWVALWHHRPAPRGVLSRRRKPRTWGGDQKPRG